MKRNLHPFNGFCGMKMASKEPVRLLDICKNLLPEFKQSDVPAKQISSDISWCNRVNVFLRFRPSTDEEILRKGNQQFHEKEKRQTVLTDAPNESVAFKISKAGGDVTLQRFSFTKVFPEEVTQKSIFDKTTLPLVTDFINGQNCLVFAYGAKQSGKVSLQLTSCPCSKAN